MENNNPEDIAELVATSLEDFRKGMEAKEQLYIRIGRRTTQIIRFGMAGPSILGVIMDRAVGSMAANMHELSKPMESMPF